MVSEYKFYWNSLDLVSGEGADPNGSAPIFWNLIQCYLCIGRVISGWPDSMFRYLLNNVSDSDRILFEPLKSSSLPTIKRVLCM